MRVVLKVIEILFVVHSGLLLRLKLGLRHSILLCCRLVESFLRGFLFDISMAEWARLYVIFVIVQIQSHWLNICSRFPH